MRRVFQFGQKVHADDLPSVPERFRGVSGPAGRLLGLRLRPSTGESWLQLESGTLMPWKSTTRTIPLNDQQSPTPPPTSDMVELRGGMRVTCHDGYVGKLEGVGISGAGIVEGLLVHIRGDVLAVVQETTEPLAALLPVANQRLVLPPAWIVAAKDDSAGRTARGSGGIIELDASAEQVRSGELLRPDADITAEIYRLFDENPALAPYAGRMRITVAGGDVTLRGRVPSPRHRASAEQDVWHVAGVSSVHNALEIGE